MDFITIDKNNIETEHICCAITEKKGENCVSSKKAWLKERFEDGLVFRRLDARGKAFIEYIPAEKAWCPIVAENYMHINCFWISGQFKGHGYANQLLEDCIKDAKAKGKCGLTIIASEKKRSFLSDAGYMKYKGFQIADTSSPFFVLYYLPFTEDAQIPKIKECAKDGKIKEQGMVLYYTNQCPHTEKYAPLIHETAKQHGTSVTLHKIVTADAAQNAPTLFTTYSFFYNGEFITNEVFSEKKFQKFLTERGIS